MQCGMHFVLSFLLHQRNGEFLQSFDKVNIIPTYRCSMYLLGIMGTKKSCTNFSFLLHGFGVRRARQTLRPDRQTDIKISSKLLGSFLRRYSIIEIPTLYLGIYNYGKN